MNWTKTPPTEPGWYWHRYEREREGCVVYATDDMMVLGWGTAYDHVPIKTLGGEWGGKVPEPGTTWTIQEFLTWIHDVVSNSTFRFIDPIITDPQDGLAAVTAQNKEQG